MSFQGLQKSFGRMGTHQAESRYWPFNHFIYSLGCPAVLHLTLCVPVLYKEQKEGLKRQLSQ